MKAFIVNRVGDLGLALGIFTCFVLFGTVQFDAIFDQVADMGSATFTFFGHALPALELAGILLFIGAVGNRPNWACIHGCLTRWRGRRPYPR